MKMILDNAGCMTNNKHDLVVLGLLNRSFSPTCRWHVLWMDTGDAVLPFFLRSSMRPYSIEGSLMQSSDPDLFTHLSGLAISFVVPLQLGKHWGHCKTHYFKMFLSSQSICLADALHNVQFSPLYIKWVKCFIKVEFGCAISILLLGSLDSPNYDRLAVIISSSSFMESLTINPR